eukprot:TRINITY_DN13313_c0_g1_i1.p1 TRINITY_DN13313_c0_g1~~TRINITY_DN13313_c0_g1_i1.p1  ORF type:complete len:198 (+),score=56.03 TRINITY_DN13313_c0_g1_i1:84-677(+)
MEFNYGDPKKPHVLVAVTGSVATIKILDIIKQIKQFAEVKVITTNSAKHFFNENDVKAEAELYTDADEYAMWQKRGDNVLHIELRRWADLLVVAPLSANTLAKIANGLSDNLLTCVIRAWDINNPMLVAPAMNTLMYSHKFTAKHLNVLQNELNIVIIDAIEKKLMCGDIGVGAMAEVPTIVAAVKSKLAVKYPELK